MTRWQAKAVVAAMAALGAGTAAAQQCANFGDVLATSGFCQSVEWVKNRAITLGCGNGTNYCPNDPVLRLTMAAFLQRLGTALTPELLGAQNASDDATPIPGEAPEFALVSCQTNISAASNYPRKAALVASFSGLADASTAAFRVFLLVSVDGGGYQSVIPGTSAAMRATLAPNAWGTVTMNEVLSLDAGKTYRFALGLRRENLTNVGGTLARFRCQLSASLYNRQGTATPF